MPFSVNGDHADVIDPIAVIIVAIPMP